MHRWYRAELYAERMRLIRRMLPDAAIGADVIVGFPGETDDDFRATVDFIEQLPFTYLHVFSFSARPGTKAANLGAPVPLQVIRERARALRTLGRKIRSVPRSRKQGSSMRALTLARGGDSLDRSADRQLSEGANRRPPSSESNGTRPHDWQPEEIAEAALDAELSFRRSLRRGPDSRCA